MSIHDRLWFFTVVSAAAIIASSGCLVPLVLLKIAIVTTVLQVIVLGAMLVPTGIAAVWLFRKLQLRYTRREAKAVAAAFLIFAPVALMIAIVVAEIPGGYAELLLGTRFAPVAAFASVPVVTALASYVPCLLVLVMTRRIMKTELMH
ncbi:MAG TPA: hypothetical protein VEG68_03500 [Terriglobales bacterium]|nr:hypothetical protein [Terriglobales bacterium]